MILQALTEYYKQLLAQRKLEAPGWESKFKVSFQLRLDQNGSLIEIVDCRQPITKGKKEILSPLEMNVPAHVKRSSGVAANFLCDNSSYMLGADEKGKPERAKQCFEACAKLHHQILDDVDDPAAKAILAFFDHWKPECAAEDPRIATLWKEITGNANLLFCINTDEGTVPATEIPALRDAWMDHYNSSAPDAPTVQCLVTGKHAPLARLHPSIKGVPGALSSGAALVSFNAPALCSYGHEQGANAPVSEYAAFAYTSALNYLLNSKENHLSPVAAAENTAELISGKDYAPRTVIGDTVFVYWIENASSNAALFLNAAMTNSGIDAQALQKVMKDLASGKPCTFLEETLSPQQHVYVLGLSPNAARISVRFFLRDTLGAFAKRLNDHAEALRIVRPSYDERENLSIWALARETVNQNSKNPTPSPQLVGDLVRAILTGSRYPATLLNGVNLRIRAEQNVTRGRAAILKAYYLRNTQNDQTMIPKEVLTMELNETSSYQPYVLGRLFAVLEKLQQDANPGINTTIKDRYFNSACATPAVVFPTLLKLAQKHQQKLGTAGSVYYSKQISELVGRMSTDFPARMTLPEQGAFEIGYYHQTQKNFTKKNQED